MRGIFGYLREWYKPGGTGQRQEQGALASRFKRIAVLSLAALFLSLSLLYSQVISAQTDLQLLNLAVSNVTPSSAMLVVKTTPATSIAVYYGPDPNQLVFTKNSVSQVRHEVLLDELNDGEYFPSGSSSRVYYKVKDTATNNDIATGDFQSGRHAGEPFSFDIISDPQPSHPGHSDWPAPIVWYGIADQIAAENPKADLVLNAGDMILAARPNQYYASPYEYPGGPGPDGPPYPADTVDTIAAKYDSYFASLMPISQSMPVYPAVGNHEEVGERGDNFWSGKEGFEQEFTLFENSNNDGFQEEYYSFNNGDTHFVVLCSNCFKDPNNNGKTVFGSNQLNWLQADLAAPENQKSWTVVNLHRPLYLGIDSQQPGLGVLEQTVSDAATAHNIFKNNGVDIVFQGDSHIYKRDSYEGIIYVQAGISGSPGSQIDRDPGDAWLIEPGYMRVDETATTLSIKTYQCGGGTTANGGVCDGDLLDSFTLRNEATTITTDPASNQCGLVGSWNPGSSTCTLSGDVYTRANDGFIIGSNGVTLDGNGHKLKGITKEPSGNYGIFIDGSNNDTIKNLTIENFWLGMLIRNSSGHAFANDRIESAGYGIFLNTASGNTITNSTFSGAQPYAGIGTWQANNNVVKGNSFFNNSMGIELGSASTGNRVYHNLFKNNTTHARAAVSGNYFNDAASPYGGNFWSGHTSPDVNGDGFVDVPYSIRNSSSIVTGQDTKPYKAMNLLDNTAPAITAAVSRGQGFNVWSKDDVDAPNTMHQATISVKYADLSATPELPASGIDLDDTTAVAVNLDGGAELACEETATEAVCAYSVDFNPGEVHTISGHVKDRSGRITNINSTFAIEAAPVTVTIDAYGGSCSTIGTWNQETLTCTMTRDVAIANVADGIQITADRVILDGNGHRLLGDLGPWIGRQAWGVIIDERSDVTVKNLIVKEFWLNVFVRNSTGTKLLNNTIASAENRLFETIYLINGFGIFLNTSHNNLIQGNEIGTNRLGGIGLWQSNGNNLTGNHLDGNGEGIHLYGNNNNNAISQNNFIGNTKTNSTQAAMESGAGNTVNGNHWSNWTSPDADSNGIVDNPYYFTGGSDATPYVTPFAF